MKHHTARIHRPHFRAKHLDHSVLSTTQIWFLVQQPFLQLHADLTIWKVLGRKTKRLSALTSKYYNSTAGFLSDKATNRLLLIEGGIFNFKGLPIFAANNLSIACWFDVWLRELCLITSV